VPAVRHERPVLDQRVTSGFAAASVRALDTPPEEALDDLTELAATVCATPISVLGLVDRDRIRYTSRFGLELAQVPLGGSFCDYALRGTNVFVVSDALQDDRFVSSPLVGDAGIRFYAGAPLVTADLKTLGTFAVLDRVPRQLSSRELHALRVLTRQAVEKFDLRRTHVALEQSERRFRSIIEEASEAYISFSTTGVIREWNREAVRLLGWSREEIVGSSVRDTVVPTDLWQRVVAALADRADGDDAPLRATRVDGTAMTKRGVELPVEFTFLPLKVGGETRVNVLLHDISARRRVAVTRERLLKTEQDAGIELTSQNERLRELDALKNQFISVVSHELRTPLTAIRGYLEVVLGEEPGPLNDEQKRFLEIADFSSEQLLRVVGDLLLIGQVEAGHLALELAEIDLGALLQACVVAAKPSADAKQIELRLTVDSSPTLSADFGRLSQAIGNIVSNAIKFTEDGHVDVRAHTDGDFAAIDVTDTGTGIPAAELDYLFVPFFRASTATRQAIPGTGLGLSIAKEIVEAHGGSISVESTEGSGTSFHVRLPKSV
jgi:PAS domain S-box-containing protein